MQAGTCLPLGVNCDVAVTWLIPSPNRSPSFEASAINLMTFVAILRTVVLCLAYFYVYGHYSI